jgi:hypothetical protein
MNNDTWLHALRAAPSPDFKEQLRARLWADEPAAMHRKWPSRVLLTGATVALVAVVILVPGVRISFAQFLSLFRVANVVGVPVNSNRLDTLKAEHLDIAALIGEQVQVVQDPGPPVNLTTLADAATVAGMPVATPQWLPGKTEVLETTVTGERVVRVTANALRLQQVMDALGISDLAVPAGLHGQAVNVRVPPVVTVRYSHEGFRSRLIQARSPQLALPGNIDVRTLGEIGLRILGMEPAEAKHFAEAIDWQSTLVVPVPPNASSFRQVKISGHAGVMIQHQPKTGSLTHTVIWSTPERVFVLLSTQTWDKVLAMANSVR